MEFALPSDVDTLQLSEEGVAVPILSLATGLPIVMGDGENAQPVTITVKGSDSKAYAAATLDMERKRNKVLGAGGDFDHIEAQCEVLSRVTVAWTGLADKQGRPAQCTPENAKALYQAAPTIRDQIAHRVANRSNFIRASSTN